MRRVQAHTRTASDDSTPGATVIVSPSATGQGIHKRWNYADPLTPGPTPTRPPSRPIYPQAATENSSSAASWSSSSGGSRKSQSLAFDGSLSGLSSLCSFETIPATPPSRTNPDVGSERGLQSAQPRGQLPTPANTPFQRWNKAGTTARFILVPDSDDMSEEAQARRKASQNEENKKIFEREYARLLGQKKMLEDLAVSDANPELSDIEGGSDWDDGSSIAESRLDSSEPGVRGVQALGSNGTELIDDHSGVEVYRGRWKPSSPGVYPAHWVAEPSNGLARRKTDLI